MYTRMYTHIYVHTHPHTHVHTHIYMHTHMYGISGGASMTFGGSGPEVTVPFFFLGFATTNASKSYRLPLSQIRRPRRGQC